jgi:hypothetical protein
LNTKNKMFILIFGLLFLSLTVHSVPDLSVLALSFSL